MNDYNVMLNDNKRLAWLDVSRGFAMFMVIYSHINMQSGPTHIMFFFRPIYLSIFFFVSGYLTKENFSFNGFFEHRTRTILFPFLFWGGVLILISQIYSINEEPIGLMDSFKELLSQYSDREHINTLWFLPFLYLSSIAFFILFNSAKVIEHSLYIAILCYFLNWVYSYVFSLPKLPWNINIIGFSCFYMALGMMYKKKETIIDSFLTKKWLFLVCMVYLSYIQITGFDYNYYGGPYLFDALVLSLFGILMVVFLSKHINCGFIRFIGANTLLCFVFHSKFLSIVWFLVRKVIDVESLNTFQDELMRFLITLLCLILMVVPILIINNFAPYLLGKKFKLW